MESPTAKGVNALELWMLGCLIMVFAALCEYGVLLFMKRRAVRCRLQGNPQKQRRYLEDHIKADGTIFSTTDLDITARVNKVYPKERKTHGASQQVARNSTDDMRDLSLKMLHLDFISLIVFPILFVVFIGIYSLWFSK